MSFPGRGDSVDLHFTRIMLVALLRIQWKGPETESRSPGRKYIQSRWWEMGWAWARMISGADDKWSGSGSVLKKEMSEFDDSQDVGIRERNESMVTPRCFTLSSFKYGK